MAWRFQTGGKVRSTPAVADGLGGDVSGSPAIAGSRVDACASTTATIRPASSLVIVPYGQEVTAKRVL